MPHKVSVITSVFNGEDYFDRGVESILGQVGIDFEYVIVDDGSTDDTPNLLARLAAEDTRIRVISPGRVGRARALNIAVESARYEYIANQDIDDISYPDRLRLQADFLTENPHVGLVGGYYHLQDDNRKERYIRQPPVEHQELLKAMSRYIPFAHTVCMFRKAAWQDADGYPDVESIIDMSLWVSIAREGWQVANLAEVVGEHWVHENSYWHATYAYWRKQRMLANVQWRAVRELGLPWWMGVYPLARLGYASFPTGMKRWIRRRIGRSKEVDLVSK